MLSVKERLRAGEPVTSEDLALLDKLSEYVGDFAGGTAVASRRIDRELYRQERRKAVYGRPGLLSGAYKAIFGG